LRVVGKRQVPADPPEEADGVEERESFNAHDEVDGIEVLIAPKAASEVGAGVRCGVELAADRTEEAEVAVAAFPRHTQVPNELDDVNVVTKLA